MSHGRNTIGGESEMNNYLTGWKGIIGGLIAITFVLVLLILEHSNSSKVLASVTIPIMLILIVRGLATLKRARRQ